MQPKEPFDTYRFPSIDMESIDSNLSDDEGTGEDNDLLSSIESQAHQAGYAEAKEQTLIDEKKRQQPVEALLKASRRALEEHMLKIQHSVGYDVIEGAVAMARDIIRHEISEGPDHSVRIMRKALQMARGQKCIKIKANPVDGETARNLLNEEIQDTDAVDKVEVVADTSVDSGG